MWTRSFWIAELVRLWTTRTVIWLSGVRRAGKTTLCQSLPDIEYFDCELPRQRRAMDDPEAFLASLKGKRVILDEVHRLRNPSELLKIAADHFPTVHIIATGSSTLGATRKFRDALTGRKAELWLTPAMSADSQAFHVEDLSRRLYRGGLPPFLLASRLPEGDYQEWMDSYWAKDIQELFRLERRQSFLHFVELLLAASGGIFEATRYSRACEVSRPTITNYLSILETTFVAHVVRPFSTGKTAEIVAAPKVYGFDTGFVCYYRGWVSPRTDDMGLLWEHYVLNELHARLRTRRVNYWRDKQGHEVDFVLDRRGHPPIAIECKWSERDFDPAVAKAFSARYPSAELFVVAQDVERTHQKGYGALKVSFVGLEALIRTLEASDVRVN
ncbi:MAG TPA: ATP-binding protein [Steroidobacteraceae bacterium]|nr:ATP-binding protein [Steroidobacteraceae bacterium]